MASLASPTVLVVDDELDIVEMVSATLQLSGFNAIGAVTIEAALDVVARGVPDAIVLDRNLEDSECGELLARLAADSRGARIPIVLLTGDPDGARIARELGPDVREVVQKPFDPETLVRALRSVLSPARARAARAATAASGIRPCVPRSPDAKPNDGARCVALLIVTSAAAVSAALDAVAQDRRLSTRHATSFREALEAARRWRPRAFAIELAASKARTMELVRTLRAETQAGDKAGMRAHPRPVLLFGTDDNLDVRLAIAELDATICLATIRSRAALDRAVGRLLALCWTAASVLLVGPVSELVEDTLRGNGYDVTHVHEVPLAFSAAAAGVDVVLIDERVRGVSPVTLCAALARSADAKLRSVVLLSMRPDEESRRAALRAGADEVLGPRESAEGIVACVRRRLERMRAMTDTPPRWSSPPMASASSEHPAHADAGAAQRRVR